MIPNRRSTRPPNWLEIASESSAEAPDAPVCVAPPVRNTDSDPVCPNANSVTMSLPGSGGSDRYEKPILLDCPVKFSVISYC